MADNAERPTVGGARTPEDRAGEIAGLVRGNLVGLVQPLTLTVVAGAIVEAITVTVREAIADEREACANALVTVSVKHVCYGEDGPDCFCWEASAAAAIRARTPSTVGPGK